MPPFFKKRRRGPKGPNKNEKKVLRTQHAGQVGTLRERFPSVQGLTLRVDFITPQGHTLDSQTESFDPSDSCDFSTPCPGRCGGAGSFDLEAKIGQIISSRQSFSENSGTCPEALYPGSSETCGVQLKCRIEVTYLP